MVAFKIDVKGLKAVNNMVKDNELDIETRVLAAVMGACIKTQAEAKKNCPVDTGRLRSSINWELEREGSVIKGKVGTNVEYAPPVEYGHLTRRATKPDKDGGHVVRMVPAKPFLRPAWDVGRVKFVKDLEKIKNGS